MTARTIPLKADWDRQPRLGDGDSGGHHVARTGVDGALADFVERRKEGALLVVGHRGSGKTSSVVAAANRAAGRAGQGRTVVPIMITATSLDKEDADHSRALLRGLIWALHRKAGEMGGIDKELRRRTEALYLDATATVKSVEASQSEARSMALSVHLAPAAAAGLGVLALGGAFEAGLAAAALAALASFGARAAWGRRASRSSTRRYRRDYGFADMQHDFEGLLREYGRTYDTVFILDEFDKDDNFAGMIRPLKMLLNQGGAAYVVITSPEKAKKLLEKRGVDSTLFSEVLYINRPSFSEMERFIDDIVDAGGREDVPAPGYDDFRCCMRYKSQTDFFGLYEALRDRRAGTDAEGRPLVAASLDEQEATEANLQRSIEHVYNRKAYGAQSKQMTNNGMLDAMYDTAEEAEGRHGKTITLDGRRDAVDNRPAEHSSDAASAVRDLVALLYQQGYLARTTEGPYRIVGRLARFDPAGVFVEEEKEFREAYDTALGALANFANVQSKLVDRRGEPFRRGHLDSRLDDMINAAGQVVSIDVPKEMRAYRGHLRQPHRPHLDPDKLREYTDAARATLGTLQTHAVDLLSRVLGRQGLSNPLYDSIPHNLSALEFTRGRGIHISAQQWNASRYNANDDDGIYVAIVPVTDASFISQICDGVAPAAYQLRQIYIALVGDVVPVGLRGDAIPVGPIRGMARDGGVGALKMAKKQSTYVMAVTSPPDVETAEAVVSVVRLVAARLESSDGESFEEFWAALNRAAGAAGSGPQGGDPS